MQDVKKKNKVKGKSIAFLPSRNLLALSYVRSCLLTSFSLSSILKRMAPRVCPFCSLPRSLVTSSFSPTSDPTWLPSPVRWSMEGRGWTRSDDSPSADCGYCVGKPRGTVSLLQPCSLRHIHTHTHSRTRRVEERRPVFPLVWIVSFRFVSFRFVGTFARIRWSFHGRSSSSWCFSRLFVPVSFSSSLRFRRTYVASRHTGCKVMFTPVTSACRFVRPYLSQSVNLSRRTVFLRRFV